ncbi:hydrogenase nickel incorporation protein HypB [Roseibium sediminicola]|uniref:Hydrogenase maturation factor HypB n=1 Tax=Roseibium sediminicola TaxID=2933272 RepID=A0ABT0GTZ0_9HYPH|nr:hydrogenase nickel incorporation protein HypB [Roseibium sp. CAU 1639]MCK7612909.1 hydrogenase nickel incorporation protein HypB [Roseibium sp. CAU 1639]
MCTVCGCGGSHDHKHEQDHEHGESHVHFGKGEAGTSVPGMSQTRLIQIEADILGKNRSYAERNRSLLADKGVLALNLVSSPGSGKTTLLVETLKRLAGRLPAAVIEGDQQTSNDADRIRETGAPAIQINTGKGCHLDAHMVGHALEKLPLEENSVLFIENVGNLVCPAGFDLGEAVRAVILSVTEGEDKPLKYPDIFAGADLMILNKTDLLPHVDFCVGAAVANARRVNPRIQVLQVSARSGEGLDSWLSWLEGAMKMQAAAATGLAAE